MNKTKTFITKGLIKWRIIDTITITAIILYNLISIITPEEITMLFIKGQTFSYYLLIISFIVTIFLFNSIKLIAIYLILKFLIKKYITSKNTFTPVMNITYYRDILKDLSPATISLLMDLNLENYKDLKAMKLYYELKNIITYDNNGNMIINEYDNLIFSDQILLKYFYDEKYQTTAKINEWKQNVEYECVDKGLLKETNQSNKGCLFFILFHIITFILIIISLYIYTKNESFFNSLDFGNFDDTITLLINISQNKKLTNLLLFFLGSGIIIFSHTANIIASIIYFIVNKYLKNKHKFTRTKEGNQIAEKIYGLKNFIKDFSNLSEATKKELVLWDEFLIYAIILEENTKILNEISNYSNKDLLKYKN